jgi:hypothetical protein
MLGNIVTVVTMGPPPPPSILISLAVNRHATDLTVNVNWNEIGLQHLLYYDEYLNALQSRIWEWIALSGKLMVLPE